MRCLVAALALAPLGLAGCKDAPEPPSTSASTSAPSPPSPLGSPSPSASSASDAPASPLSVVLTSTEPLTFSGLGGGVAVANAARTTLATAAFGEELAAAPMPEGLPTEGRILSFAGRWPGSVWVHFESPKVGKDPPKNPFLRLERAKGRFKSYADDWKPHLAAWSKGRILAVSTSSGKLKVKVVEPYQDNPSADLPGALLDDAACAKTLKIEEIAALPSGEVFAAGSCAPEDGARRPVLVRWPVATEGATTNASATAEKSDAGAEDAGAEDAGAEDAGEAPSAPPGIPGEARMAPRGEAGMRQVALVAQGPADAWVLVGKGKRAALYRLESSALAAQPLPKLETPVRGLAGASDGTLWLVTERAIWKRYPPGEWEQVPPPTRAFPEPAPRWEMFGVWAGGSDVWIAAKHESSVASRSVVLRQRPTKSILHWK